MGKSKPKNYYGRGTNWDDGDGEDYDDHKDRKQRRKEKRMKNLIRAKDIDRLLEIEEEEQ
jgi:hypothetical protein